MKSTLESHLSVETKQSKPQLLPATSHWHRRNLWLIAALLSTLVGSLALSSSSVPDDPLVLNLDNDGSISPADRLEERRLHAEKNIRKRLEKKSLQITILMTCFMIFPLNGLLTAAWIWRRRWPLRLLTIGALGFSVYGISNLVIQIQGQRKTLSRILASQDEMRRNTTKAKEILTRLDAKREEALQRFIAVEQKLNKTDVIDQLTLFTLKDLRERQELLREAIEAGKHASDLAENEYTSCFTAFKQAGIDPLGSGEQAQHEFDSGKANEKIEETQPEELPFEARMEAYAIKLELLNLTERIWAHRSINIKAHTMHVDGDPESVKEYKKLLGRLERLEDEASSEQDETTEAH